MRLTITHTTEYLYDQPVSYILQRLRLTPVDGPTQKVLNWMIEVDGATVETGYQIQVPLFVETGTRVKVDTRTGDYLGRVTD